MGTRELSTLNMDVYDTRKGLWNPEYGDLVGRMHSGSTVDARLSLMSASYCLTFVGGGNSRLTRAHGRAPFVPWSSTRPPQ